MSHFPVIARSRSRERSVAGGDEAISESSYERLLRSARNDRIVEYFSGGKSK